MAGDKAEGAFRTIGEVAAELGVQQHILRYWETRFPQLRPLQRAGNRRYYRPADVALAHRINRLLNQEGYTVRGVQQLLDQQSDDPVAAGEPDALPVMPVSPEAPQPTRGIPVEEVRAIRDKLALALIDDVRITF